MNVFSKPLFPITATTQQGLEPLLAAELKLLGATHITQHNRAVSYQGNLEILYRSNLWLRTALRVMVPIARFKVTGERDLYEELRRINWETYLKVDQTLAVDSIVKSDFFNHSQYVALKTKDAIVDEFRDKYSKRPSVDVENPDVRINIHIFKDDCTVSLNSSGDSLHRRGYRADANLAPLNEVTAAALIQLSGWDGKGVFLDPMCGSGTILIEAAMFAKNMAPGLLRKKYGFETWNNFDAALWQTLKDEAYKAIQETDTKFIGSDKVFKVTEIARNNVMLAGLDEDIRISNKQFEEQKPPAEGGIVIMNPPYGERLPVAEINAFYKSIGDKMKKDFQGYKVWILSSNKEAMKHIGLATYKKYTVWNGPLECKFHGYDIYAGSKKGGGKYDEDNK
jgi:putative N6-adenine-specific DNA methylase